MPRRWPSECLPETTPRPTCGGPAHTTWPRARPQRSPGFWRRGAMAEPLPSGKLDPELLERCLDLCPTTAEDVILGPGLGEDAALVATSEPCLVLKSDPITFATDRLGWYAVHIAANDVATRGVEPRWMLLTLLLPTGSTAETALSVFEQVGEACRGTGVVLVGGHTEVTPAVTQPVVSTALAAPTPRGKALSTRDLRPGDHL
ncbi:MAG: hypothetical protein GF320_18310, partial [Armatimonadia bacterium]|nr:hypothetical protein [Armatimonadia bacterium]